MNQKDYDFLISEIRSVGYKIDALTIIAPSDFQDKQRKLFFEDAYENSKKLGKAFNVYAWSIDIAKTKYGIDPVAVVDIRKYIIDQNGNR